MKTNPVSRILTALLLSGLVLATATAMAADTKPVAVISFAGYDALKADLAYLGRVSENPELDTNLEGVLKLFTQNKGLVGLDKSRPWGGVLETDGERLTGYAFVPVSDLDGLFAVLEPLVGKPNKGIEGVYQLTRGRKQLFIKAISSDWVAVADRSESLETAAADPASLVADLAKDYDLAARLYADNVPEALRERLFDQMKRDIERDLRKRPGESDADYAARVDVTEKMSRAIEGAFRDLNEVTLGWVLDAEAEKAQLDVRVTFKPGSRSDEQAAALTHAKSHFAGFDLPGAAMHARVSGTMPQEKADIFNTVIEALRAKALGEIDNQGHPDEVRGLLLQLTNDLSDTLGRTVSSLEIDGAMSVMLNPNGATVVMGQRWVDATRLADVARQFVDLADQHRPEVSERIKLDADKWHSITLHTASIPIPANAKDRTRVTQLFGDNLEVVVGLGENSLYLAAGRDAMATLKQALERSSAEADVPLLHVAVALRPIAEFIAELGEPKDRAKAADIARCLSETAESDQIGLTAEAIPHGLRYRLELGSGVVRVIGKAIQNRTSQ